MLDREQVGFLAEDAPDNVQTMLRTKGYFNSHVTVSPAGEGYVVAVAPSPQTKIENVGVAILGDILQDEDLSAYYKNALNNSVLPVGDALNQSDWSSSKTAVLSAVPAKNTRSPRFPQPGHHQSDAKHGRFERDGGSRRPVYFGDIDISGTQRYPVSVARGLARFFPPAPPYDLDKLLDYQQALEQDGHYSGASVRPILKICRAIGCR